jgi:peptidoglycan/xylan/chitin deacetylase (PgdA/CDA1 family)
VIARHLLAGTGLCAALAGCASAPPPAPLDTSLPPARFLLTFDDGPSAFTWYNPTRVILDTLAENDVQPGIKAVFFVQTRARGAAAPAGHALLVRTHADGHVLGLHSGSARGHLDHRHMAPAELDQSLQDGIQDLTALAGQPPSLVRPPFWDWDARTRAVYEAHGLAMLLTDINARDGKIYGWTISLRRRSHFRAGLARVRAHGAALPAYHGVLPVVITFHDTNTFTASHLQEYLHILLEESRQVGLPIATPPFYNSAEEIEVAAQLRARAGVYAGPP